MAKSTAEATAARQKSLDVLAKIVLDNRIALDDWFNKKESVPQQVLPTVPGSTPLYYNKYKKLTNKPLA